MFVLYTPCISPPQKKIKRKINLKKTYFLHVVLLSLCEQWNTKVCDHTERQHTCTWRLIQEPKLSGWHLRHGLKALQVIISCTRKLDMLPVCGYSNTLMGLPRCSLQPEDLLNLSQCEAHHLLGIYASCMIYSSIHILVPLSEECFTFLSFSIISGSCRVKRNLVPQGF